MKLNYIFLSIITFFIMGCTSNISTSLKKPSHSDGKISLSINNNPQNVEEVIAYLSRSGYSTLISRLNLLNNGNADLFFKNVDKGKWHLKVDAKNSSKITIYSGESNVEVENGQLTRVNLTLSPDNNGKGSIYLKVNWGTQYVCIDYSGNPIMTKQNNPSNPNSVGASKILYDNGIYKMWYTCTYNSGKGNVWYAESLDGIKWQNKTNQPVFTNNYSGTWDDYTVGAGAVIKDHSGNYLMYYNGWSSQNGKWQIGLAISSDGIHWKRYNDPILKANNSNEFKIGVVSVLKIDKLYYMYYSSSPKYYYDKMRINLATSQDGLNWTRFPDNPILNPTESWEGAGVTYPSVIYDDNRFIMIYNSTDRTKFGIAFSEDGKKWTKNSNYFFDKSATNSKWEKINYPFLMKYGNEYHLYYSAIPSGYSIEICFAEVLGL